MPDTTVSWKTGFRRIGSPSALSLSAEATWLLVLPFPCLDHGVSQLHPAHHLGAVAQRRRADAFDGAGRGAGGEGGGFERIGGLLVAHEEGGREDVAGS